MSLSPPIDTYTIRPVNADELPTVLAINQANVPEVGPLDLAKLKRLTAMAHCTLGAFAGSQLAGFILTMAPSRPYESDNYQWFETRYSAHLYIDRIAVTDIYRGQKIGQRLYQTLIDQYAQGFEQMSCEVNLVPPNAASIAFHQHLGFTQVGQQNPGYGGVEQVAMFTRPL